jgi:hypothetical protein
MLIDFDPLYLVSLQQFSESRQFFQAWRRVRRPFFCPANHFDVASNHKQAWLKRVSVTGTEMVGGVVLAALLLDKTCMVVVTHRDRRWAGRQWAGRQWEWACR